MALWFEWDQRKAHSNFTKHGILFSESTTVFADPLSITIPDPDHSSSESRFLHVGLSSFGRLLVLSYTEQGDRIRIISARPATRGERKQYEEAE